MRRSSTPVAHFHTSKLYKICIYVYFSSIKNHNGTLNSSRLDLENVNYELILRIQEVLGPVYMYRKLDWLSKGSSLNATILNFEKWKSTNYMKEWHLSLIWHTTIPLFTFRNSKSSHLETNLQIINLTSDACKQDPNLPESSKATHNLHFQGLNATNWMFHCDFLLKKSTHKYTFCTILTYENEQLGLKIVAFRN